MTAWTTRRATAADASVVVGLREYEIGPHAARRILRSLLAVRPDLIAGHGLPAEADDLDVEVRPEDLADAVVDAVAPLVHLPGLT